MGRATPFRELAFCDIVIVAICIARRQVLLPIFSKNNFGPINPAVNIGMRFIAIHYKPSTAARFGSGADQH